MKIWSFQSEWFGSCHQSTSENSSRSRQVLQLLTFETAIALFPACPKLFPFHQWLRTSLRNAKKYVMQCFVFHARAAPFFNERVAKRKEDWCIWYGFMHLFCVCLVQKSSEQSPKRKEILRPEIPLNRFLGGNYSWPWQHKRKCAAINRFGLTTIISSRIASY